MSKILNVWFWVLVWVHTWDPDSTYTFFGGKSLHATATKIRKQVTFRHKHPKLKGLSLGLGFQLFGYFSFDFGFEYFGNFFTDFLKYSNPYLKLNKSLFFFKFFYRLFLHENLRPKLFMSLKY